MSESDLHIERDTLDGWSLPAWTYNDPEFAALEVERIFRPSWQVVCHVSDVPNIGDWHSLDYMGESVIVGRGANWLLSPQCGLRLRIVAPFEQRVELVATRVGVPREEAYGLRLDAFLSSRSAQRLRALLGGTDSAILELRPKQDPACDWRADLGADPAADRFFLTLSRVE